MEIVVYLIVSALIGYIIAYFLGKKRRIGFYWSLFFSIFLTPIFGFFVTIFSNKDLRDDPNPNFLKRIVGKFLIVIGSSVILVLLNDLISNRTNKIDSNIYLDPNLKYIETVNEFDYFALTPIIFAVGFIGLGYFLYKVGQGENFNFN